MYSRDYWGNHAPEGGFQPWQPAPTIAPRLTFWRRIVQFIWRLR